jgi:4-amino-4-deoxy-L-arabinose transferase-like glycosyltransferase
MVRPNLLGQEGDMTVTTDSERRQTVSARNLATIIDFATQSHARAVMLLVVVALLNILPGFFAIPPTDRDEARFAQATKQMLETGDYVDIRFQDEVRYKKPVGIYWLQAGAVKAGAALGVPHALTTIWLYRLPSLLGAIGAVLLTYWTALAFVTRRAAVFAGLMMATCLLLSVEGRIAKTDAMLLASVVATMGALARAYLPEQRKWLGPHVTWLLPAIFWTGLAAGVLLKGPVILMLVVLSAGTLVAIDRSASWLMALRPLSGLAWFAVLVLPWFLAIVARSGESFFAESVGHDLFSKLVSGQESHGAPPGYYFALFWLTFWPGAALAGLAAPAVWAARREPGAKFLLAWIVPSWIVFEIVVTKLPHYVLPLYPAIAILIAGIVDGRMLSTRPWLVRGTMWWFLVPLLAGLAGIAALLFIGRQFGFLIWPAIGASIVMGLLAWRLYDADGPGHSLLRAASASILNSIAMFGLIVPALPQLFPSATLAGVMRESGCADPRAASAGYHEPSLVFLAGTETVLTDAAGAADFLRGGDCRFAFIDARQERSFAQRADAVGARYAPGPRIEAINIGNGRPITIAVYRSVGQP